MFRYFTLLLFVLFFLGCSPRYVIKNEYVSPKNINSKSCVDKCLIGKNKCQKNCEKNYNNCLSLAFDRAKRVENIEYRKYKNRYVKYINQLDKYNYNMMIWQNSYSQNSKDLHYFYKSCKKYADKYACERYMEIKKTVDDLLQNKPQKPISPQKPSFNQILLNQQNMCQRDCGCQSDYDNCFVNCGGKIILHKICVENCN